MKSFESEKIKLYIDEIHQLLFFFCPIYSHFFLDSGQSVETQSHSITFPSILYSVASLLVPIPGPNKLIGWQKTSGRTKRIFGGSWCAYKFFLSSLPAGYNAHFRKDTRYTVIDAPTYCPCSLTQWNRCRHSQKCNQQWWAHVANITFKEIDSTYAIVKSDWVSPSAGKDFLRVSGKSASSYRMR